MTQITPIL